MLRPTATDATVHRSFACRYVICMAHDLHFLPFINVSGQRISWLIAKCGSVVDEYVNPRGLRSSLVLNMVTAATIAGRAQDNTLLNILGGWINAEGNATLKHYFTSVGAVGLLATLVRSTACVPEAQAHRRHGRVHLCLMASLASLWASPPDAWHPLPSHTPVPDVQPHKRLPRHAPISHF